MVDTRIELTLQRVEEQLHTGIGVRELADVTSPGVAEPGNG